jgi:putative endopeptidase
MPIDRRFFIPLLTLVVCATTGSAQDEGSSRAVPIPARLKVFDPSYIDKSVSACQDFFAFANGTWIKHDTIPAAFSTSGVGKEMTDANELIVRSVLEDAMAARRTKPASSTVAKLGRFYASCMDSTRAEREGVSPVKADLAAISAVNARPQLVREIATLQRNGTNALFNFFPNADPKDAAHYMVWITQGGLGMPDRDYYTKSDAASDSLREKYVAHVAKTLALSGEPTSDAAADARRVMALETELAKASMTRVEQRDPNAIYHKTSLADLQQLSGSISWPLYFRAAGLTVPISYVNVSQPNFLRRAGELVGSTPLEDWRAYLRYHLLSTASPWLSSDFAKEDFAYRSLYSGATEMLPRWKRCLRVTDSELGEALGQAYVEKTFSPQAKAEAKQVIENIRASFRDRLMGLSWMSDSTRRYALGKLARMNEKVGYPDRWRDYSDLQVYNGAFAPNVFRANTFEWRRTINRPGKPVDKTEWNMTVPTVNAYYDPSVNEMVFPAGALLPQTFDASGDMAANYGSLGGSWAGHELTHGFDDEGRHYDAEGNLRDWWAADDSVRFNEQAQRVVDQFAGYVQVDTFHVNGKLTLGENIADYGGLITAYDALQRALARKAQKTNIGGYTPEQRFFIAYAQSWREHTRPEQLRTRVTTDPHAPAVWRTNGPVSNMPSFAKAFNCKPGDPMVRPASSVPQIW